MNMKYDVYIPLETNIVIIDHEKQFISCEAMIPDDRGILIYIDWILCT